MDPSRIDQVLTMSCNYPSKGLEILSAGHAGLSAAVLELAVQSSMAKLDQMMLQQQQQQQAGSGGGAGSGIPRSEVKALLDKRFRAHVTALGKAGRHVEAALSAARYIAFSMKVSDKRHKEVMRRSRL